jgi:hypothetical protein
MTLSRVALPLLLFALRNPATSCGTMPRGCCRASARTAPDRRLPGWTRGRHGGGVVNGLQAGGQLFGHDVHAFTVNQKGFSWEASASPAPTAK